MQSDSPSGLVMQPMAVTSPQEDQGGNEMKKTVELVYRAYAKKQDEITRGFITQEHIEWVTDHLMLRELTDQELSEMWETVDEFFDDIMAERDEKGNITGWKPYTPEIAFAMDTDSAWKEVINVEARRRRAGEIC